MWTLIFLLALLIPLVAVILDSPVGRAAARWIESRSSPPDESRMQTLEAEVERMARELDRLQEQSVFLTRLLEERAGESAAKRLPTAPDDGG